MRKKIIDLNNVFELICIGKYYADKNPGMYGYISYETLELLFDEIIAIMGADKIVIDLDSGEIYEYFPESFKEEE